ncbi:hypothetical protein [Beijerinckia sp. L45]|uniref:hypothetical protein n=1 Tax=Beijerinckia sp. L45 TaxID=1641855 RepID=UPI00131E6F18|nr:hypothetical protein [Beijerinckia sp. L45]
MRDRDQRSDLCGKAMASGRRCGRQFGGSTSRGRLMDAWWRKHFRKRQLDEKLAQIIRDLKAVPRSIFAVPRHFEPHFARRSERIEISDIERGKLGARVVGGNGFATTKVEQIKRNGSPMITLALCRLEGCSHIKYDTIEDAFWFRTDIVC